MVSPDHLGLKQGMAMAVHFLGSPKGAVEFPEEINQFPHPQVAVEVLVAVINDEGTKEVLLDVGPPAGKFPTEELMPTK
jgi:hypothetical protein